MVWVVAPSTRSSLPAVHKRINTANMKTVNNEQFHIREWGTIGTRINKFQDIPITAVGFAAKADSARNG